MILVLRLALVSTLTSMLDIHWRLDACWVMVYSSCGRIQSRASEGKWKRKGKACLAFRLHFCFYGQCATLLLAVFDRGGTLHESPTFASFIDPIFIPSILTAKCLPYVFLSNSNFPRYRCTVVSLLVIALLRVLRQQA